MKLQPAQLAQIARIQKTVSLRIVETGAALFIGAVIAIITAPKARAWESLAAVSTGQGFDQSEQDERDRDEIRNLNQPRSQPYPARTDKRTGRPMHTWKTEERLNENDDGASWKSVETNR